MTKETKAARQRILLAIDEEGAKLTQIEWKVLLEELSADVDGRLNCVIEETADDD